MKQKEYIEPSPVRHTGTESAIAAQAPHYKKTHQVDLLRFITAGSVDDGKSTLIGRLMYDTKSIFEDQLKAIEASSKKRGDAQVDLALLTDGLKAEREQGITIDVAYRYFSTPNRKFIMADTPGHIEYTRNMFTGASTADAVIILIDARHGVIEQTRRHTFIATLLGIRHIIVAINKMDLVDFDQKIFEKIKEEYQTLIASTLSGSTSKNKHELHFIPISALRGDNVVDISKHTPWYKGDTILETLENVDVHSGVNVNQHSLAADANPVSLGRFPVQRVIRPQSAEFPDFRGYAGRVEGGVFRPGDSVVIFPSDQKTRIDKIYKYKNEPTEAVSSDSIVMTLVDDIDISRGDMIVQDYLQKSARQPIHQIHQPIHQYAYQSLPQVSNELNVLVNWFSATNLQIDRLYILRHTTLETKAVVKSIEYKIDIQTLTPIHTMENRVGTDIDVKIGKNDIARIQIKTAKPLYFDLFSQNKVTGSILLIDSYTNETVAAGVVV
ncbi:MAG: sulfate adenylyltransferase subunit 1 [Patescibacteria group bacterium]|nr:sulfate adenylyltransferase subunit 1 [Patescibacteria group bacterium]